MRVTAKDTLPRGDVLVATNDVLVDVATSAGCLHKVKLAGTVRQRKVLKQVVGCGVDPSRGDYVPRESSSSAGVRAASRVNGKRVINRRHARSREITCAFRSSGNVGGEHRPRAQTEALPAEEYKCLVLNNRTTNVSAELVLREGRRRG